MAESRWLMAHLVTANRKKDACISINLYAVFPQNTTFESIKSIDNLKISAWQIYQSNNTIQHIKYISSGHKPHFSALGFRKIHTKHQNWTLKADQKSFAKHKNVKQIQKSLQWETVKTSKFVRKVNTVCFLQYVTIKHWALNSVRFVLKSAGLAGQTG